MAPDFYLIAEMRKAVLNVRGIQPWSVHYAVMTVPTALVAAGLILWPLRKPMPFGEWLAIIIISVLLFALVCL